MSYLDLLGDMFVSAFVGLLVAAPFVIIYQVFAKKKRTILQSLIFCFIISFMFSATETPDIRNISFSTANIRLVPFAVKDAAQYLLNALLFVPFGFYTPLMWRRFRNVIRAVLLGLFLSLFVEVAQIFNHRVTDIDDLIMNTLGCFIGYLAFIPFGFMLPKKSDGSKGGGKSEIYVYIAVVFVTAFFLKPLVLRV